MFVFVFCLHPHSKCIGRISQARAGDKQTRTTAVALLWFQALGTDSSHFNDSNTQAPKPIPSVNLRRTHAQKCGVYDANWQQVRSQTVFVGLPL